MYILQLVQLSSSSRPQLLTLYTDAATGDGVVTMWGPYDKTVLSHTQWSFILQGGHYQKLKTT